MAVLIRSPAYWSVLLFVPGLIVALSVRADGFIFFTQRNLTCSPLFLSKYSGFFYHKTMGTCCNFNSSCCITLFPVHFLIYGLISEQSYGHANVPGYDWLVSMKMKRESIYFCFKSTTRCILTYSLIFTLFNVFGLNALLVSHLRRVSMGLTV